MKLFAGLGLFLFAMNMIETALRDLAGKRFKLILKKYTSNRFLAICNGILATTILQSSSIVMLLVISFVGAGMISLSSSLGIILGANIGTTATGWFLTLIGFKFNLEILIWPFLAIGCLGLVYTQEREKLKPVFNFIVAFAFILLGLSLMKENISSLTGLVQLESLKNHGWWAFFLFGLVMTAIIQSSSAMMSITLSAMYAQIIGLESAVYVIIGADLGTTMTAILATLHGQAIKKRVGLAHLIFNLVTTVIALIFAQSIIFVTGTMFVGLDDLQKLVLFHSSFNAIGVMLFIPFLPLFEKLLNRFYSADVVRVCKYIHGVSIKIPDTALEAIEQELKYFTRKIYDYNVGVFGLFSNQDPSLDDPQVYADIKKMEGELLEYFVKLQQEKLNQPESTALSRYIQTLRNGVQSAKAAKDIHHNFKEFAQSVNHQDELMLSEIRKYFALCYEELLGNLENGSKNVSREEHARLQTQIEHAYQMVNEWIYSQRFEELNIYGHIATYLNINREVYNSCKYLRNCLEDFQT